MRDQPHAAGRQHAAAEPLRPGLRIGFHRDVERRLMRVRGGDGTRGFLAVIRDPAPHQPVRRVAHRGVFARETRGTFARDAPQARR